MDDVPSIMERPEDKTARPADMDLIPLTEHSPLSEFTSSFPLAAVLLDLLPAGGAAGSVGGIHTPRATARARRVMPLSSRTDQALPSARQQTDWLRPFGVLAAQTLSSILPGAVPWLTSVRNRP